MKNRNPPSDGHATLSPTGDAEGTPEQQAAALIAEAVRSGVIDPLAAVCLTRTGVLGHPTTETAHTLGLSDATVRRTLRRAQRTMRAWLHHPPHRTAGESRIEPTIRLISDVGPRRYQKSQPAEQLELPWDDSVLPRPVPTSPAATSR